MLMNETTQPTRRERERLARRQLILDAALKVFAYKGFSDAKLDDVAELAEFGKATLYSYFPTKEALFESVLEAAFTKVKEIAEEAFAGETPFEDRLERFIENEMLHFYSNPESLFLMMSEAHHLRGANPMLRLMPDLLAILITNIEAEQKRKHMLAKADPTDLAMLLLNMLFGQYMARIYRHLIDEGVEGVMKDEKNVQTFLEQLRKGDLKKEIATATTLIHTVYLHGTVQSTSNIIQKNKRP